MPLRKIITVDGLAGSGKSTLAKLLAQELKFTHFNSGLVYRVVGLTALKAGLVKSPHLINAELAKHTLKLRHVDKGTVVLLDDVDVTSQLQSPDVSEATSISSAIPEVRATLLSLQREAFSGEDLVAEGRDMGTVVFPEAPLKFFVVADTATRIKRRLKQLFGPDVINDPTQATKLAQEIDREITERDKRDSQREVAPTKPAPDAVIVDNSSDELASTLSKMSSEARQRRL